METRNKHIDLKYLKEISNGSNEFMNQMITLFVEQTPEIIAKMEKSNEENDIKGIRASAHKMKPSIAFMGIDELKSVIQEIEGFSENGGNNHRMTELISQIKSIASLAIDELKAERKALA